MMNIAIMCSGGDAPGMNPAIKKFVDLALKKQMGAYLVYDGLEGLIDGKIHKASHQDVAGILHLGGTVIRSSRSKRFFTYEYRKQAFENLRSYNIESLIVLGGDGSFRAMNLFSQEFPIHFVGIPSTIDNDIYATSYCLGVDTALNVIRDAIDKIKDTASSFNRAFVVETMGRSCGYLAAVTAMVSGAEICVIPEVTFEKEKMYKRLHKEFQSGRRYLLAVVAEGSNQTQELKQWIEESFDIETRVSVLGHIQRGGSPSVKDRLMAFEFMIKAFAHVESQSNTNSVVVYNDGIFDYVDIGTVTEKKYTIAQWIVESLNYLD
jgi:6-phosphofructokinase 1